MSAKLRKQIEVELAQLGRLMERHPQLLIKGPDDTPAAVEIDALATLLHSFYSGVENLFKRISVAYDGGPPTGRIWHAELLDTMTRATPARDAVISLELRASLRRYLDFRHVFRHAYSLELRWDKMAPLVAECPDTFRTLEREIVRFVEGQDDAR